MNITAFQSELVSQEQYLKSIRSTLNRTLTEIDALLTSNAEMRAAVAVLQAQKEPVLTDAGQAAAIVQQSVYIDHGIRLSDLHNTNNGQAFRDLIHGLITAGGYNYEQVVGAKLNPSAKGLNLFTEKLIDKVVIPSIEDTYIYQYRDKEVVFYTEDSAFGDLFDKSGLINATYLPDWERNVLVYYHNHATGKAVTRNDKYFANDDNLREIETVVELAHYLLGQGIVQPTPV